MTNFPTTIDQFNNPTASTKTNAPGFDHAQQHTDANKAIRAIQTKIGVDNSTDEVSIDYIIRRLVSRRLVVEPLGVGDGVETTFPLTFEPIGDLLVLENNTRITSSVVEKRPGEFEVVFNNPPNGILTIISMKETL